MRRTLTIAATTIAILLGTAACSSDRPSPKLTASPTTRPSATTLPPISPTPSAPVATSPAQNSSAVPSTPEPTGP